MDFMLGFVALNPGLLYLQQVLFAFLLKKLLLLA